MRKYWFLSVPCLITLMILVGGCNLPLPIMEEPGNNTDLTLPETATPTQLPPTEGVNSPVDFSEFFREELQRAGVERVGMPVEGFNAFIYLEAFPGFEESDFDGVETLEGIYTIEDEKFQYVRTAGDLVTSAEETISEAGYKTLLENFSKRVGVEVETAEDIATSS